MGPVTAPLIALGKLIKAGWNLQQGANGLVLAKGSDQIAVHYRRNSLCTMGHIRAVSQDEVASSIAPPVSNAEFDMEAVRRVELSDVLRNVGAGWKEVFPDCFALKCTSDVYLDITSCLREAGCKYRTTIILDNGVWELVEFGQDISELANLSRQLRDQSRCSPWLTDIAASLVSWVLKQSSMMKSRQQLLVEASQMRFLRRFKLSRSSNMSLVPSLPRWPNLSMTGRTPRWPWEVQHWSIWWQGSFVQSVGPSCASIEQFAGSAVGKAVA